jgi:integrase
VDADFSLKAIGDFVGHRKAASTEIYAKVAVASLREVVPGRRRGGAGMSESLAAVVCRFLTHRRALGRKYHSEERELRLLVRFAEEWRISRLDQFTPALLEEFLASRPRSRPRSFNHLLGVCLMEWAVAQELLAVSPLRTGRRRVTSARVPFLFDAAQARRLLGAAAALPDNSRALQRGPTYRTTFALCYGLGLRVGEACRLHLGDIDADRDLLVVVGGKFGKSRLVPHGPRIARLVADQVERRLADGASDVEAPLFSFDGHRCAHPCTTSQVFHRLIAALELPIPDGVSPPRLHDLRHSFAVGCVLRWYREGLDPASRLHQLSTFMGHVDPPRPPSISRSPPRYRRRLTGASKPSPNKHGPTRRQRNDRLHPVAWGDPALVLRRPPGDCQGFAPGLSAQLP